jgi:hypothetical protein
MSDETVIDQVNKKVEAEVARRKRIVRTFPASSFEDALQFARDVYSFGSGQPVRRLSLFDHLNKAPESGQSRQAITNAGKYSLIKGSYSSEFFELTPDAKSVLDEEASPRERARAKIRLAIEQIDPFKKLYERFVGNKLPAKAAMVDAISEFDVSPEAAGEAVDTFIVNLKYVGLLATLSGAERIVTIEHLLDSLPASSMTRTIRAMGETETEPSVVIKKTQIITSEQASFDTTCFYISPLGEDDSEQRRHSDLFLGSFVEPALDQFGLKIVRADAIDKPGVITKQIIEFIVRSRLVVVDLSYHNPNVFYELALRHMMRLPIVQIARASDRIPFDINQMRTIRIDTSDLYSLVPKIESYRAEIASQARRALDASDTVDTPISIYFPGLRVTLS